MNRWQRLWLFIKLLAAAAACVAVSIQAFRYMMESPDAAQIHPLSIVVAGLIFGFVIFGLLSLVERAIRRLVSASGRRTPQPYPEQGEAELPAQRPLDPPAEDLAQDKPH